MPEFDPSIAEEFANAGVGLSFLGTPLFDGVSLLNLLVRFVFNLLVGLVIVRGFYYRKSRRREYLVTLLIFSATMFLLIYCMGNVKLQIGLTLGLFAIFGMIRYRTETIPVREMTYLFVIIGISVINGLALELSYTELVAANLFIILLLWVLDGRKCTRLVSVKTVQYDRGELITPQRRTELVRDLEDRLGVKVLSVEIGGVDFLKDSAIIKVHYEVPAGESCSSVDSVFKDKQ